jgi:hypothetical protein
MFHLQTPDRVLPRIARLAFGLIGDSLHPRSRVATKNPRAARNRGACPTPPRPASEERQGSEEDWQRNEDHVPSPLPLFLCHIFLRHIKWGTANMPPCQRPRNLFARD